MYSLILATPYTGVHVRIESLLSRMSSLFMNAEVDMVKLNRLATLYMILLQIARLTNERTAKQLEAAYLDYENGLKFKDANSEFEFMKPFFKDRLTTSLALSQKCKLRTFLYNLAVTGDYYGKKLSASHNSYYTQYFNLLCFSFYRQMAGVWPPLSHYTTQTIAKSKSQSERHEFAIYALVRFINCYAQTEDLQEGTPESLRSYLGHLAQMLSTAVTHSGQNTKSTFDLESLLLAKTNFNFDVIMYEEQQSCSYQRTPGRRFDHREFIDVLERHLPVFELKTAPKFGESLDLLYSVEPSEKRLILYDKIRETFIGEPVMFIVKVKNMFKVT